MTIYINVIDCNGCGGCAEVCPKVFAMAEGEDKPVVLLPDANLPCVDTAMTLCPRDAIDKE